MTRRWYAHGDVIERVDPHNPFAAPVCSVFCILHDACEVPETFLSECAPRSCLKHTRRSIRAHAYQRPSDAPNALNLHDPCGALSPCACRRKRERR